jgi:23S rRNA (uridine2552-2'-O)-methyltransferase
MANMSKRSWNQDAYSLKAKRENFLARSIYKLEEIDRRENIFHKARMILDLGASPGSWTQYCLKRLSAPDSRVIAVDISPLRISHPRLIFLQTSIEQADIRSALKGAKADVVLSDMAPKTSGIHDQDVARSEELARFAFTTATRHLRQGGIFVAKIFMGESLGGIVDEIKPAFESVRLLRPESTRKHSREIFVIAKHLREEAPSIPAPSLRK